MKIFYVLIFLFLMPGDSAAQKSSLDVVKGGKSDYVLLVPSEATENEKKAAEILQHYFRKVTGAALPASKDAGDRPAISIGRTAYVPQALSSDSFTVSDKGKHIILAGDGHRSILFAVYHFIENYLNCRKWAPNEPAECPQTRNLRISLPLAVSQSASFPYREVYSTAETDQEYMDWYKLQSLDDYWGLWGHSFSVLVPAENFRSNPEYFAISKGKRTSQQLCLSNPKVLELTLQKLEVLFADDPNKKFWSVSPNDNGSHCECDRCSAVNSIEGGPQGSLIRFVNKIAVRYPERTFTTLAYGATAKPPLQTKPENNIIILLSNIEIFRNNPVATEKSAAGFRNNLEGWLAKTPNVFVWDYHTQFTNYLAPFPDVLNSGGNLDYYSKRKVQGVFAQLGGRNYVDQGELKTYILARKLWNAQLIEERLTDEFLSGYYGKAAPFVKDYILHLKSNLDQSGRNLDIYGNPVSEHNSYLAPEKLKEYYLILKDAGRAAGTEIIRKRLRKLSLSLDYTVLQQAKLFGKEAHGIYTERKPGEWVVRESLKKKIRMFGKNLKAYGIRELSENGQTPEWYVKEWAETVNKELPSTIATGAVVRFEKPWISDYPAKGAATLTDGMYGMRDFSLNWLLFDGGNTITIDLLKETTVSTISSTFLEDQRHWIIMPKTVRVAVSADGSLYKEFPAFNFAASESPGASIHPVNITVDQKIRYIRVSFDTLEHLPDWMSHPTKKPLVGIDEIWVN